MEIDWENMPQKEFVQLLAAARTEKERRIAELREASGETEQPPAPKGPGRPRTNGVTVQD